MFSKKLFGGFIGAPVGNGMDNGEEDVRRVRMALEETGHLAAEEKRERDHVDRPLGIITRTLGGGIRDFQRDNDLKEDGFLNPGGETEASLVNSLRKKQDEATSITRVREEKIVREWVRQGQLQKKAEEESPPEEPPKEDTEEPPEESPEKGSEPTPPKSTEEPQPPEEEYPEEKPEEENKCEEEEINLANASGALVVVENNLKIVETQLSMAEAELEGVEKKIAKKEEERTRQSQEGRHIGGLTGTAADILSGKRFPSKFLGIAGESIGGVAGPALGEGFDAITNDDTLIGLKRRKKELEQLIIEFRQKIPPLKEVLENAKEHYAQARELYMMCKRNSG